MAERGARHPAASRSQGLSFTGPGGGRVVEIAVGAGARGSAASQNRVAVYDWFSGFGTPPRSGNVVEILIDGEESYVGSAARLTAPGSAPRRAS
jgi:hypothetical protein